ncbi:hypothetical protein EV182_003977 [Spiromyces aspiralis]|uniref:Uncharacterized protein n=1 Tax=Spiromyces aspiralis TaxID=68401 RepID=A0ACC1HFE2_9FUNG|nr:hypothetical protein EV182_003977 [Spiromyces aspiralis]
MSLTEQAYVKVDSLPYIDKEYNDPEIKAKVDALVEEELKSGRRPTRELDLPQPVTLFQGNPLLRAEYDRVKARKPMPRFDVERYKLEPPAGDAAASGKAWRRAAENAAAQLEHQALRMINLELLQQFGANAWQRHNFDLERILEEIQGSAERLRHECDLVNKARKAEQTEAEARLRRLQTRWIDSINKNLQIELACQALEAEIWQLESQLGARMGSGE